MEAINQEESTNQVEQEPTQEAASTKATPKAKKAAPKAKAKKEAPKAKAQATKKPSPKKEAAKPTKKAQTKKEAAEPTKKAQAKSDTPGRRGRESKYAGLKIFKLVSKNPRREGTIGYNSFSLITSGMRYEKYVELGGRPGDLAFDEAHQYVEVRKA